jgi:hypothetical protein
MAAIINSREQRTCHRIAIGSRLPDSKEGSGFKTTMALPRF